MTIKSLREFFSTQPYAKWVALGVGVFCFLFFYVAEQADAHVDALPQLYDCGATFIDGPPGDLRPFPHFPGLTNKIVGCTQYLIERIIITQGFSVVRNQMGLAVGGTLTLAVLFFGIKLLLGGVRAPVAETAVLMISIVLVAYFVLDSGIEDYAAVFFGAQEAFTNLVTDSMGGSPQYNNETPKCDGYDTSAPWMNTTITNTQHTFRMPAWQRVDCMIAYFMGGDPDLFTQPPGSSGNIAEGAYDNEVLRRLQGAGDMIVSIPYFAAAMGVLVLSPGLGFLLLLGGLFVILLIIGAFGQAMLIYITSFVALVFLALIAPVMVPMVLFRKTQQLFTNWLQQVMGYILQPAIVMGFLTFMTHILIIVMSQEHVAGASILTWNVEVRQRLEIMYNAPDTIPGQNAQSMGQLPIIESSQPTCGTASGGTASNPLQKNACTENSTLNLSYFDKCVNELPANTSTSDPKYIACQKEFVTDLTVSILTVLVVLAMTMSMMNNVLNFGSQLVGISIVQVNQGINVYNMTAGIVNSALKRGSKRVP